VRIQLVQKKKGRIGFQVSCSVSGRGKAQARGKTRDTGIFEEEKGGTKKSEKREGMRPLAIGDTLVSKNVGVKKCLGKKKRKTFHRTKTRKWGDEREKKGGLITCAKVWAYPG